MRESDFLDWLIDLARLYRWRCAHFRPARIVKNGVESWRTAVSADGRGFPDVLLIREGDIIVAELKSEKGKLSPEQEEWLQEFARNPIVRAYVWRPADRDLIEEILK